MSVKISVTKSVLVIPFLFLFSFTSAIAQDCNIEGIARAGDSDSNVSLLRPFLNLDTTDGFIYNDPGAIPAGSPIQPIFDSKGYFLGGAVIHANDSANLLARTTHDVVKGRYLSFNEVVEIIYYPLVTLVEMHTPGYFNGNFPNPMPLRAENSGIDGRRLSNNPRSNRSLINATVDGSPGAQKVCEMFGFQKTLGANYRRSYTSPHNNYAFSYYPSSDTFTIERADRPPSGYMNNTGLSHFICADPVMPSRCTSTVTKRMPEAHGPVSHVSAFPILHLRANAAGPLVASSPDFLPGDMFDVGSGANYRRRSTIDMSHPSVPAGTPEEIFQSTHYDGRSGDNMQFAFMTPTGGTYDVSLYFAEIYRPNQRVGRRVFDVSIDGNIVLDDFDVTAEAGAGDKAIVKTFTIVSDGEINIEFHHDVRENPIISAIEIKSK